MSSMGQIDDLAASASAATTATIAAEKPAIPGTSSRPVEGNQAEGGDCACWAHLVCPECGAITTEGHRQGCGLAPESARASSC